MRTATSLTALLVLASLSLVSCSGGGDNGGDEQIAIQVRSVTGTVALPAGTPIDLASLDVLSFAERVPVDASGAFTVLVPDTDLPQALLVMGGGPSPVLLGWVEPQDGAVVVNCESTARALTLLNPFMTMFSPSDRETVVEEASVHYAWDELVAGVEAVVSSSSVGRISEACEPGVFQMAAGVALDVLVYYPQGLLPLTSPWLEDVPGSANVACVNPTAIFWGFRFATEDGTESGVRLVESDRGRIRVLPAWPPVVDVMSATRTDVALGDGTFVTSFAAPDFRTFDTGTPEGLATVANCGRAVEELLAPLSGVIAERDARDLDSASWAGADLGAAATGHDTYGFMKELAALVRDRAAYISEWYWNGENSACAEFIAGCAPLVHGTVFATEVLAAGETRVPFFSDLVSVEPQGSQRVSQLEGTMVLAGANASPRAEFSFAPPVAAAGFPFAFSAASCTDPDDPVAGLEVRWDWENDGEWDTSWMTEKTAQHSFASAGIHEVALQVRDGGLLNDRVAHRVNVGGSEANASHVIVFRDAVPWAPEVPPILDQMLEVMEFTQGPGPGQYEVVGSSEMGSFTLTPGEDLVIVQSDQPQDFYNAYSKNQMWFLQFVVGGGTLFWEACDMGWNGGSIQAARIVLPGAVELEPYQTWQNFVVLPGAAIVQGLPDELYGQYASHEGIESLPDGATVYITDDSGSATLAEFGYGSGWVIMTTQPLEWNFYHNWTSGYVMPHVVSYVLGVPLVHDFGDIVKPELRGRPRASGGASSLTSWAR